MSLKISLSLQKSVQLRISNQKYTKPFFISLYANYKSFNPAIMASISQEQQTYKLLILQRHTNTAKYKILQVQIPYVFSKLESPRQTKSNQNNNNHVKINNS